ncbi:hypothetical protein D3C80_1651510 [compost metagenome]
MGQDDRVALALQPVDLADQPGLLRPLQRGDEVLDLVPHRSGLFRQFLRQTKSAVRHHPTPATTVRPVPTYAQS